LHLVGTIGLWLFAARGFSQYVRSHYLDQTFKGLYHLNAFDLALLIPYFTVLVILAGYGFHRYILVYMYYKNKKNKTTQPDAHYTELPRITW